jgi:hypothetical protein
MKNLIIFSIALLLLSCAPPKQDTTQSSTEPEKHAKYKKGDVVCVVEFGVKGIVQYESPNFVSDEPIYSVMFNSAHNELYNLSIYESQLTECQ